MTPSSPRNRLLRHLNGRGVEALVGLEKVQLEARQVLEAPGVPVTAAYFVESGLVSMVATTNRRNHRIEVGMIGFEGMTGTAIVLGDDRPANECIVQSPGQALRISISDLRAAMARNPEMRSLFLRYVHVFTGQSSQTALANGRGRIGERLARWILMWQDRIQDDGLVVTHEFLSLLLGVRRSGVTVALHVLEGQSLIKTSRTLIRVTNREGLQAAANGFYGIPEAEYDRLIGPLDVTENAAASDTRPPSRAARAAPEAP